jgi:predicted glycosyltransferase involved in capsule biosynthesis
MHEAVDEAALAKLCKHHEAALVFTKPRHKVFSRGFALNVGARYGSRRLIALLDADVVLHPDTIKIAANQCASAVMAIIPVVRTQHGPNDPFWQSEQLKNSAKWKQLAQGLKYERGGFGNALVNRAMFEKIHGHDETFFGWGGIDTDLYYRMLKSGRVINLEDIGIPRALHQHHPPPGSKQDPERTRKNRERLKNVRSIVRNEKRWGTIRCR